VEVEKPRWLPHVTIRYTIPKDVSLSILTEINGSMLSVPFSKPTAASPYARRYHRNVQTDITRVGEQVMVTLEAMEDTITTTEMVAAVNLVISEFSMLDLGLLC
jgi:hypothetical protein